MDEPQPESSRQRPRLGWLAWEFAKIGLTGFGGGFAIIALIQRECVERKKCLSAEEFLHGVSLGQLLGSFAVNTAFFVGYRLRGAIGGLVAMVAFLAPSVAMVIGLSWLYTATHQVPSLQNAMNAAGPVVIAILLSAATSLGAATMRGRAAWVLAALGLGGTLGHFPLMMMLLIGLAVGAGLRMGRAAKEGGEVQQRPENGSPSARAPGTVPLLLSGATAASAAGTASAMTLATLCWTFLKIGCVFFGGGYVLVPLLQHELVMQRPLLTMREFLDGVAISQLTPGPIAVLATFVGFRFAGAVGAVAATAALYLPATVVMAVLSWAYARVRQMSLVQHALSGVGPVIVGMILASAVQLAPHSSAGGPRLAGIIVGLLSYYFLRRGWHPAVLLATAAMIGIVFPKAFV